MLARAFAIRADDPLEAADLFAKAGPGPSTERARQSAWYDTLARADADAGRWRAFIDARPQADLSDRATIRLARALATESARAEAIEMLRNAPPSLRNAADVELLELADATSAADAARRLARSAPHLLRQAAPELEQAALVDFDHQAWMERAAAWRAVGLGSRGAAELRRLANRGAEDKERRKELARCELDAGSSTRALNALPSRQHADSEALVLRAEAYRRQAWGRFPRPAARRSFATCLDEVRAALTSEVDADLQQHALVVQLECATESGDFSAALAAWRRLEARGWTDRRRSWLGRRLGIALARHGSNTTALAGLASALPSHRRCLRYWQAATTSDTTALAALAAAPVTDLYARWAADEPGVSRSSGTYVPAPVVVPEAPPPTVSWLSENATATEALAEWLRICEARRPTRGEAVAVAAFAATNDRANTSIRLLRRAFPNIGSVALLDVPDNVARAYLPLDHVDQIKRAARESGLDPWLIAGLARQESTFVATARSPAGARGLLQLLPSTARLHARRLGLGIRPDLEEPATNLRIGARELAFLLRKYNAVEPALAAYNAGDRRVRRWWAQWPDRRVFTESIPIPETYSYVRRVVFLADAYRHVHADAWKEAS